MTWYCAHIIIGMKKTESHSLPISVWENVILIEASSFNEATQKAILLGREEEKLDDELTIDGKPASRIFAGVRKIVSISNEVGHQDIDPPSQNCELTYSEYEVDDLDSLMRLGKGERVKITYIE